MRTSHPRAAREQEIERLDASLAELERLGAPRPVWVGLRGHAEALLDDWYWSLEAQQGEDREGA